MFLYESKIAVVKDRLQSLGEVNLNSRATGTSPCGRMDITYSETKSKNDGRNPCGFIKMACRISPFTVQGLVSFHRIQPKELE